MSTIDIKNKATSYDSSDRNRLTETNLEMYGSLALLILQFFNRSEDESVNYEEFIYGLRAFDVVLLEGKAKQIFQICSDDNQSLDLSALELALIMNDELSFAEKGNNLNLFDLFSSFDSQNKTSLTFAQFTSCMNAPGMVNKYRSLDVGILKFYYRRYVMFDEALHFKSFCKLWCNHFTNVHRELRNRGHRSRKNRRYLSLFLPWRKDFHAKKKLFDVVYKSKRDVSELRELRKAIESLRRDIRSQAKIIHRSARNTRMLQQRETLLKFDKRNKHASLFFRDECERKLIVTENRHEAMSKILKDYEKELSNKHDAIIRDRLEKDSTAEKMLKESSKDRIDMSGSDLECVPLYLYKNLAAQHVLSDVCILDLSKNSIKEVPDFSFFYHLQSLRKLNVSSNNLTQLPEGVNALKSLQIMIVDHNRLNEIPSSIGQLNDLRVFSCRGNYLSSLPEEVCFLKRLKILNASFNCIKYLPENMGNLEDLQVLDLQTNEICLVIEKVAALKNIIRLDLSSNSLTSLPDGLGSLKKLEHLNLSFNHINFLPDSLEGLQNLRVVQLHGNKLIDLPECTRGWINVSSFEFHNCGLSNITSRAISGIKSAQYVSLEKNLLKILPSEIALSKSLVHLKLGNNSLNKIPVEIGALVAMESLDLSYNLLEDLPQEFCLLKSLIWLDISFNRIKMLPRCIGSLSKLCYLEAAHNLIHELPDSFIQISHLNSLNLSNNSFENVPSVWCKKLECLRLLNMDGNKIKYLPSEIITMSNLRILSLRHNLLRAVPLELGRRINGKGMDLDILLEGNTFRAFPIECLNHDGRVDENFFTWLNDELSMFGPCAEEWKVSSSLYITGQMMLRNFVANVKERCEKSGVDVKIDRVYRFFNFCQKRGNTPCYVKLSKGELLRRDLVAKAIALRKDSEVEHARVKNAAQKAKEERAYFNNFEEKLKIYEERYQEFQRQMLNAEKLQGKEILKQLCENLKVANALDSSSSELRKIEANGLNCVSFALHSNHRRNLPLEIKPCWNKDTSKV